VRARPLRDAPRDRRLRRVRSGSRRLDHFPVHDAASAREQRTGDSARDLGRAGTPWKRCGTRVARCRAQRVAAAGSRRGRRAETEGMTARALVVGATGISGGNVAQRLLADGWEVAGMCRRPDSLDARITPVVADLLDANAVAAALRGNAPTPVFFTTWSRCDTEAENCEVNGRMLQNLLDALSAEGSVRHVALVT